MVAVRGGTAWVSTGEPGRPATRLGPASYALAAADPRRVWLVEETGDPDRWFRVREVEVDGPATARRWPAAPCRSAGARWPGRPAACCWTWSGRAGAWPSGTPGPGGCGIAAGSRTGTVVAASGGTVAWVEGATLHLGDLAGGRPRVVPPRRQRRLRPAGRLLTRRAGAGRRHPRSALDPSRAGPGQGRPGRGGAGGRVGGALSDRCSPCVAWAPAGDWVFFNRLGPGFGIGAYRLDHPPAATVPLDVPGSFPPSLQTI